MEGLPAEADQMIRAEVQEAEAAQAAARVLQEAVLLEVQAMDPAETEVKAEIRPAAAAAPPAVQVRIQEIRVCQMKRTLMYPHY